MLKGMLAGRRARRVLIVLSVVAVVLVGLVGASVVALGRIDWNDYREPLTELVRDATGRQLDLGGKLDVRIGLRPRVTVDAVTFENAAWGTRPEMATLDQLELRLRLLPLLLGEVEIGYIALEGLDVLLETNPDGVANWTFESDGDPEAIPEDLQEETGASSAALLRRGVLTDARITYRDGATGETQEILVDRIGMRQRSRSAPLKLELESRYRGEAIELDGEFEGLMMGILAGTPIAVALELRAGGAEVGIEGRIEAPLEASGIDLALSAAGDSLADLSTLVGSPVSDIGAYQLSTKLTAGDDRFSATDLGLALGDSKVTGDLRVDSTGERPRIEADLESPRIDTVALQRLLGSSEEGADTRTGTSGTGGGRVFSSAPIDLEGLTAADVVANVEVKELQTEGLAFRDVAVALTLEDGKLEADRFAFSVYGGEIQGRATLEPSAKRVALATAIEVDRLDIAAISRDQGTEILTGGLLDLKLDVRGSGSSVRSIMASLSGSASFGMGRGTIKDKWAERLTTGVAAAVANRGSRAPAEFHCLIGDFVVKRGIATPTSLVVDSPSLSIIGQGTIDLRQERLDLDFDRQMRAASASSATLPPFRVVGAFSDPEYEMDAGALASKVLDLGGLIVGGRATRLPPVGQGPPTSRCRQIAANYKQAMENRELAKQKTKAAAKAVGKQTQRAFDKVKGFFGR